MASNSNRRLNSSASRGSSASFRSNANPAHGQSSRARAVRLSSTRSGYGFSHGSSSNARRTHGSAPSSVSSAARRRTNASRPVASGARRPAYSTSAPADRLRPQSQRTKSSTQAGVGSTFFTGLGSFAGRFNLSGTFIAGVFVFLIVVAIGAVAFLNSSAFAATDIRIKGSEHVTKSDAEQLVSIPKDTSLINVNESQIVEQLKQNPWVEGVQVERRFPHTLIVKPTERKVMAIVYIPSDELVWAVSKDRTWIAPVSLSVTCDASGNLTSFGTTGTASTSDPVKRDDKNKSKDGTSDSSSADGSDSDGSDSDGSDTDGSSSNDSNSDNSSDDGSSSDGSDSTSGGDSVDGSDNDTGSQDSTAGTVTKNDDGSQVLTGKYAAQAIATHYHALLLTDVPTEIKPTSGQKINSGVVNAGLDYASGFSSDFLSQIKEISIASKESIQATMTSGVEVLLGEPDEISKKERVISRLLSQQSGVTYINVRTSGSYSFRSAPDK